MPPCPICRQKILNHNPASQIGCSVVIGHHPHVIQGVYVYNGATVVWSLGNFVFGGNKEIRDRVYGRRVLTSRYSLVVRARLDFADDGTYLGQQVTLYPAFSSDHPKENHYQPCPVHGEDAAAVIGAVQFDTKFTLPEITEAEDYPYATMPYLSAESPES